MTNPPPYLMQGIQLVQSGLRDEALPYLRYAARNEPMIAEGWLWLAAATDDPEEYRHAVGQALVLEPAHPIALRMQADAAQSARWLSSQTVPGTGSFSAGTLPGQGLQPDYAPAAPRRARGRGRWLPALAALLIVLLAAAAIAALASSGGLRDRVRGWVGMQETQHTEFTVGTTPAFRFAVEVPKSWMPADEDSAAWRTTRARLIERFPAPPDQVSVWEQVDEAFSQVVRDPVYGVMMPNIRLVETDPDRLAKAGMVTALTLQDIKPLPEAPAGSAGTVCDRMRALEQQFQSDGSLSSVTDNEVVNAELVQRGGPNDCVYTLHRRYTHQTPQQIVFALAPVGAPDASRSLLIAVPVGDVRYATWLLTLSDNTYGDYRDAIDRIVETLEALPGG